MPPIELLLSHAEACHMKRLLIAGAKSDLSVMASSESSDHVHLAQVSLMIASEMDEQLNEVCVHKVFGWDALEEFPSLTKEG